jgi:type VI secretion system protein ImpA
MPLREDILNPVPGDNPSGENLRYAPVYDKIKEARRQDDDAPQGDWQTARKVADYKTVVKLTGEAIATKSKDLQLAAWLTEALLHTEGIAGLNSGLTLIRGLIENFWDTLHPELEDGEAEYRAAPVDWVGGQYLTIAVKQVPLTKSGFSLLKYQEAKIVGREEDAAQESEKQDAFQAAIAEGKLSMDEWEKSFTATSKNFYKQLTVDFENCLQTLDDLQPVCEEKFGEFTPSFAKLRTAVEEVQRLSNQLLDKKREVEPDPEDQAEPVEEEVADEAPSLSVGGGAAAQPKRVSRSVTSIEPADKEDAVSRVAAVAAFWRKDDPYSPAPYLLLRGLRWGELRASSSPDPSLFDAPSTAVRTNLKRMMTEGSYAEVIELAENAMAMPCGRAWLDLQRYVVGALDSQGYSAIVEAVKSELKGLIRDFPDLPEMTLLDDTPTANRETQEWLKEFIQVEAAPAAPVWAPPAMEEPSERDSSGEEAPPDTFALAMQAASSGRSQEALELLSAEIGRQNSGRGRFQRKLQLAQVCLSVGQEPIAHSILEELAATIDKHDLEHWEAPDVVAHALALLWGCMNRNGADAELKQKLYARICRLDPVQALAAGSR